MVDENDGAPSGANFVAFTNSFQFYVVADQTKYDDGLSFISNTDTLKYSDGDFIKAMHIDSGGKVGIGTTSPTARLDVEYNQGTLSSYNYSTTSTWHGKGLRLAGGSNSGGFLYGHDINHSIFLRQSPFSTNDHNAYCNVGYHAFYTGGHIQNQTERLRITSDGNVGIGTTSPGYKLDVNGTIYASGDVIMFSDERKKTHIEAIPNALEKVLQLRGVTFNKLDDDNRRHSGVIAQEVEKVLPEVVYTAEDDTKSVAYGNMIGLLIEAIKELAEK
jgi:hypothetical protein